MRQANPSVTELIRAVARHFVEDDCSSVAKALTYQTLFALVPTIALAYMVLTAFDAFQGLLQEFEAFVFSNIVPESVGVVQSYLAQFSEHHVVRKCQASAKKMELGPPVANPRLVSE